VGPNQSPIDLQTVGYEIISAEEDDFNKIYTNEVDKIVEWNGHTSIVHL